MNRTRRLILAVFGWTWCLASSELSAQQQFNASPMVSSHAAPNLGLNANARQRPAPSSGTRSNQTPMQSPSLTPVEEKSFVAVIGAIKHPGVYQTQATSIPLHTLIEKAGGESSESIGAVRIIERGMTRFAISLRSAGNRQVMPGQIVYVSPRGGHQFSEYDRQSVRADCWIMVSGLAREPVRLNINSETVTLTELLNQFGQSPELVTSGRVVAVAPQGRWVDLESPLVTDSVVYIEPGAIDREGVLRAIQGGLNIQPPIDLDLAQESKSSPPPGGQPGPKFTPPRETLSLPREKHSTLNTPRYEMSPETSETPHHTSDNAEIERTGSSTGWPEPNLFPSSPRTVEEPPHPNGHAPILLPRVWTTPSDDSPSSEVKRVINRTSAERRPKSDIPKSNMIVTAAAEFEDSESSQRVDLSTTTTKTVLQSSRTASAIEDLASSVDDAAQPTPSWTTPQSWMVLSVVIAVALGSVLITYQLSKIEQTETAIPELASPSPAIATQKDFLSTPRESSEISIGVEQEQDRFLQRLILNKVTLVEEKATIEPSGQLHGHVIGTKRMVIHEAQPIATGPHFRVRPHNDTRDLEIQLRQILRSKAPPSTRVPQPAVTSPERVNKAMTVSALERALRAVEGGPR